MATPAESAPLDGKGKTASKSEEEEEEDKDKEEEEEDKEAAGGPDDPSAAPNAPAAGPPLRD